MKLEIGQELHRYTSPTQLVYKVIGIRNYEDSEQYEVECQSCKHGEKCQVLIARDDYGHLDSVNMLNNNEDNDHRCWHTKRSAEFMTTYYHTTKDSMQRERLMNAKHKAVRRVEEAKKSLATAEAHLIEIDNAVSLLVAL